MHSSVNLIFLYNTDQQKLKRTGKLIKNRFLECIAFTLIFYALILCNFITLLLKQNIFIQAK